MEPLIEKFSKLNTPSRAQLLLKLNQINLDKLNKRINNNVSSILHSNEIQLQSENSANNENQLDQAALAITGNQSLPRQPEDPANNVNPAYQALIIGNQNLPISHNVEQIPLVEDQNHQTPVKANRRIKYTNDVKKEAVELALEFNNNCKAAKKMREKYKCDGFDESRIREWINSKEFCTQEDIDKAKKKPQKRNKTSTYPKLDKFIKQWLTEKRSKKQEVRS